MQKKNPLFEDFSKMASGAAGMMMEMRRDVEKMVSDQVKSFTGRMDMVSREEFDVVKAMAEKARTENEALAVRIAALEAAKPAKSAPKKPAKK